MTYDINDISEKLVSDVKIEEECKSETLETNQNYHRLEGLRVGKEL